MSKPCVKKIRMHDVNGAIARLYIYVSTSGLYVVPAAMNLFRSVKLIRNIRYLLKMVTNGRCLWGGKYEFC
jgi:hypothetical protein